MCLTLGTTDFEVLCVGSLAAKWFKAEKNMGEVALALRKSRSQDFGFGPFLSPDGVKALGTGLLPAQLKGQAGTGSFKAEKAVASKPL